MSKDLIKWSELSRKLSGSDSSIRKNKIPKKYKRKVNRLLWILDLWEHWANELETMDIIDAIISESDSEIMK